jgi:hypothetical protein
MEREHVSQAPIASPSIEALALYLLFGTLVVAQVLAAFSLAAPETDPVIRRTALCFGTSALLAILIEVDYHRRPPPPSKGPLGVPGLLNVIDLVPQAKPSCVNSPLADDSPSDIAQAADGASEIIAVQLPSDCWLAKAGAIRKDRVLASGDGHAVRRSGRGRWRGERGRNRRSGDMIRGGIPVPIPTLGSPAAFGFAVR